MSYAIYSADPVLPLYDSTGAKSIVRMERVEPLTSDRGSGAAFDPLISTWAGGTSVVNRFRLLHIPAGTYSLYLYAGQVIGSPTAFYLSVNGLAYTLKTATPTGVSTFVQNNNYVLFSGLVLAADSVLDLHVVGYLAGLQLQRV